MPPVIPDYELLRPVGRGAYGEVWLARSVTGVFRAAKIVYRANFEEARPFEREFAGIQRFEPVSRSQENQISVLHVGRNEGQGYFYYVMELADDATTQASNGAAPVAFDPARYQPKTLKQVVDQRGRLTTAECLPVAIGLCRALAHLHRHGLIHRDVKPSNIIFVNGHPKLADIGLVSNVDATRSFVGTEGYVPPEGPGTAAADLFSMGKVLYEAATGRPRQDYPLLPAALAELPDREGLLELNEIILKACAEDSTTRYRSAEEMLSELLLIQAGKSVKRLHAMERRFKRVLPALATCGALALCVIVVQQLETSRARQEARVEAEYRRRAEEQERKTRELLYAADMDRVQQAYQAGDFGRAEDLLSVHVPAAGNPDLRGFEWWYYWRAIQGQQEALLNGHSNGIKQVTFSEDGNLVLSAAFDGQMQLWDWQTKTRKATLLNSAPISSGARSHDGERFFLRDEDGRFECRQVQNSQRLFGIESHCLQMAVSPVEEVVAVSLDSEAEATAKSRPPDRTKVLDNRSGRELFSLPDAGRVLRFSRDGRLLAIGKYDGQVTVWDLRRREVVARLRCKENRFDLGFSPEGGLLAVGEGDGTLSVWDLSSQQLVRSIQTLQIAVWQIAWSPDGRQLATAGSDQTVRLWDSSDLKEIRVFRGHRSEVWCLAFSPDGRRIVSGSKDQSVRIWSLAPAGEEQPMSTTIAFWAWPIFSSDSHYLAAGQQNGVGVWRARDGQSVCCLTNTTDPLAFSDDNNGLWVSAEGAIELHSLSTRGIVRSLCATNADLGAVRAHDVWRRGQLLALGYSNGQIALWDLSCGVQLRRWTAHPGNITAVSFSPDGEQLLSTSEQDRTAKVWDVHTGRLRHGLEGHKLGIFGAAFSPDGKLLATASPDDTCRLWSASTFEPVGVLGRHRSGAYSVSFGASGRNVIVATGDHRVKLWSLPTLREMSGFETDPVVVFFAGFSPDEQSLATVSFDGTHNRCVLRLLRGERF